MDLCSKRKFPRSKKAFLSVLVFLLLLEMARHGYVLSICKVVLGPCNFPDSQQLSALQELCVGNTVLRKNCVPGKGCACVHV